MTKYIDKMGGVGYDSGCIFLTGRSTMKEKKIDIHVLFTEQELAQVHQKMEEIGVTSRSAYLRKMALDGYCINLDLKPVKEMLWFCEHKETQHKHTKNARVRLCYFTNARLCVIHSSRNILLIIVRHTS